MTRIIEGTAKDDFDMNLKEIEKTFGIRLNNPQYVKYSLTIKEKS